MRPCLAGRWLTRICAGLLLLANGNCGNLPSDIPGGSPRALVLERAEPDVLLPGTWVRVHGQGIPRPSSGRLTTLLSGNGMLATRVDAEPVDESELRFRVDGALFDRLSRQPDFYGLLIVTAEETDPGSRQTAQLPVHWTLQNHLEPALAHLESGTGTETTFLGAVLEGDGLGFLLEGEGTTELRLSNGTFTPDGAGEGFPVDSRILPVPASRTRLVGRMTAETLGIHPGVFRGDITPVNRHLGGLVLEGPGLEDVVLRLGPTVISGYTPTEAGRGQWIDFHGLGFASGTSLTVLRVTGEFEERRGTTVWDEQDPLWLFPDVHRHDLCRYILRVHPDDHGRMTGLGAAAGTLRGRVTPVVIHGSDEFVGESLEFVLDVPAQKQVVFLKYLPGFSGALKLFGLRNVEEPIRSRVLEVVRRDFDGINVEFRTTRPQDYLEYVVIEIGGEDPNGAGILGADNNMPKDKGNLHFDEVIGGFNAAIREKGFYAYGGVFVASYLNLSPRADGPSELASPRFDDIFGPFMPGLGGREAAEWPEGPRSEELSLAIHALGSMIGNTISHELGHVLGLTVGPVDVMHNVVPAENQIMDAGLHRPFEERAEIDGQGPARFTEENRIYLEKILPQ